MPYEEDATRNRYFEFNESSKFLFMTTREKSTFTFEEWKKYHHLQKGFKLWFRASINYLQCFVMYAINSFVKETTRMTTSDHWTSVKL